MKKLIILSTLVLSTSQLFGAEEVFLANAPSNAGVIVFKNGNPHINLNDPEAQDLIASAEEAIEAGAELTEDEAAIMEMVESHEE